MTARATFVCLDGHLYCSWKPRPFGHVRAHISLVRTVVERRDVERRSDHRRYNRFWCERNSLGLLNKVH